jgi:hypothetical protein
MRWSLAVVLWLGRADRYDPAAALRYSYAATAAYCGGRKFEDAQLLRWRCGEACDRAPLADVRLMWDRGTDAFAVAGLLAEKCVLAFRGTTDLSGWIRDLQSGRSKRLANCSHEGTPCRIGEGWLHNYQTLAPQIKINLNELQCGSVAVIGHSLGAAEAVVAMYDLKRSGFNISEGYTYGQPRVGNYAFAEAFRTTFGDQVIPWRLTHGRDPIPHLPPMLLGFHHVRTEVFYPHNVSDGYTVCSGGEDPTCSDQYVNLPGMLLRCTLGQKNCPHLWYLNGLKDIPMDGASCNNTHRGAGWPRSAARAAAGPRVTPRSSIRTSGSGGSPAAPPVLV